MISSGERHAASRSPVPPVMSPLSSPEQSSGENENEVDNDKPNQNHDSPRPTPRAKTTSRIKQDQVMSEITTDSATIDNSLPADAMDNLYMHAAGYHAPLGPPPNLDNMPPPTLDMLLALANMSAANMSAGNMPAVHPVMQLPTSIAPSQMRLATADSSDVHGNMYPYVNPRQDLAPMDPMPSRLQSFARIEFADSEFQMTTYAVIIGRDQGALVQARRDAKLLEDWQRRVEEAVAHGLPMPPQPPQKPVRYSRSWYSEEGGMLGPESDPDDADPRRGKRRKLSLQDSGETTLVQSASAEEPQEDFTDVDRQYVAHTPGAAVVDLAALRPSPSYVPKIGIHSPGPTAKEVADNTKAISRKHLRIEYDQRTGVFVATALHKNGFFCHDVFYGEESEGLVLRSGDHLQIKDVSFVFYINGVGEGETGAEPEPHVVTGTEPEVQVVAGAEPEEQEETGVEPEVREVSDVEAEEQEMLARRYSEGGKEMSFDFDNTHGDMPSTSEEESPMNTDGQTDVVVMETIEQDDAAMPVKPEPKPEEKPVLPPFPPKKRGPGRPPKNGIMSKREERDLKKKAAAEAAAEKAKTATPAEAGQEPPVKRKVGRPRKHPLPEADGPPAEKRKYTARKPKGGEDGTEGDKPQRREKPKTPPLELDRAQYTEEQLAKPPKNYSILIDEVLPMAPDGLTLKQIYKRIQIKYPYYYFHVDTKGWESSVRHNLLGNDAFRKNEQTHLWSRVPGVDLDAGKKRRVTPPDHGVGANMYQGPQHGYQVHQANAQRQPAQLQTPVQPPSVQVPLAPVQMPAQYPLEPVAQPVQSTPHYMVQQPTTAQTPPYLPATATPPAAMAPQQQSPPAPPPPSVFPPDLVKSVTGFKENVTAKIRDHTSAPEAIALSVINRGLGLMEHTLAPSIILLPPGEERDAELRRLETIEKVVFGMFEARFSKDKGFSPGLIATVDAFRQKWTKMLAPRMGNARGDAIIMSAVDRALGLVDHSVFQVEDAQRREFEGAETMLVRAFLADLGQLARVQAGERADIQFQTHSSIPSFSSPVLSTVSSTVATSAAGYAMASPTPAYTAPVPVTAASLPGAFAQTTR